MSISITDCMLKENIYGLQLLITTVIAYVRGCCRNIYSGHLLLSLTCFIKTYSRFCLRKFIKNWYRKSWYRKSLIVIFAFWVAFQTLAVIFIRKEIEIVALIFLLPRAPEFYQEKIWSPDILKRQKLYRNF